MTVGTADDALRLVLQLLPSIVALAALNVVVARRAIPRRRGGLRTIRLASLGMLVAIALVAESRALGPAAYVLAVAVAFASVMAWVLVFRGPSTSSG